MADSNASTTHPRFGWIGLGSMGLAMATNLQKHLTSIQAPPLNYTNRTTSRGEPLAALGAMGYYQPIAVVADSDIIFISLSDDTAVLDTIRPIVALATDPPSYPLLKKLIVDTSTIAPSTTKHINHLLTDANVSFIAAPVFGATPVAAQGQLLVALAGPSASIATVKPYISACLARSTIVVGTDPSQATLLKTTGNFITAALAEMISEAHVLAEKSGLPPAILDEMIKQNYGTYAGSISEKLVTGVYCPPRGERPRSDVKLAVKDVSHGIDAAREAGMRLEVADVTFGRLNRAVDWGTRQERELDSSAVYGVVRLDAGLDFENEAVKARDSTD